MDSLFQALANSADGAFVIDEDQRVIYWNQAAEETLGCRAEDGLGGSHATSCQERQFGRSVKSHLS